MRGPVKVITDQLPEPWATIVDWVLTIAITVGVILAIKTWFMNPYKVPSASMEPTFHCGAPTPGCSARYSDRILAARFVFRFRDPLRGQVVVFNTPPETAEQCGMGGVYVKRILGLPGDTIREESGTLFINGQRWDEPYLPEDTGDEQSGEWKVPAGEYFMMGDNRAHSCDSRKWGSVPRADLIGPVIAIYWPLPRIGLR